MASKPKQNELFFQIDWADFKQQLKTVAIDGKSADWISTLNRQSFEHDVTRSGSFSGTTLGQIQRWLSEGYQTEVIRGLTEFVPPIREKRKLRFNEEGDEFHFDIAASGGDSYMSEWTKREVIPGVALECAIMFSASTNAEIVAQYQSWICKIAYSLESSGIDCQITLDFPSWNQADERYRKESGTGRLFHNIVRVKKENEASDFLSWSAMLSPAALRNFGFALMDAHCDSIGERISGSKGRGVPEKQWGCRYNAERRVIQISNQYMHPYDFPSDEMTRQFRDCLKEMQGKLTN
jgi:hypothetical protein